MSLLDKIEGGEGNIPLHQFSAVIWEYWDQPGGYTRPQAANILRADPFNLTSSDLLDVERMLDVLDALVGFEAQIKYILRVDRNLVLLEMDVRTKAEVKTRLGL